MLNARRPQGEEVRRDHARGEKYSFSSASNNALAYREKSRALLPALDSSLLTPTALDIQGVDGRCGP
jgi:hypothetical protein